MAPTAAPAPFRRLLRSTLAKGMTEQQLATAIGCSQPSLSRWIHGRSFPQVQYLKAMAKACGVSVDDLLALYDRCRP